MSLVAPGIRIETNAKALNDAIAWYVRRSGKTVDEALRKQGAKLAFDLQNQLKRLSPNKGATTARMLQMLRSRGAGIHVRKSIRDKFKEKLGATEINRQRLRAFRHKGDDEVGAAFYANRKLQGFRVGKRMVTSKLTKQGKLVNLRNLMVKRELAVRESGRGFLSRGSKFANTKIGTEGIAATVRGLPLSKWGAKFGSNPRFIRFEWSQFVRTARKMSNAMTGPRALMAVANAMAALTRDILAYVPKGGLGKR